MSDRIQAWRDGELTSVDKLEVHRLGLKHPAVSVFVMAGDKVLLQRRAMGKYHTPGLWANTCCTHPAPSETTRDCAIRRLDQELGITGLDPSFRDRIEYRADVGGGLIEHEVVDVFVARASPDLTVTPNPNEVMETRWLALSELARDLADRPGAYTPWLRIYMSDHSERIFGVAA